MRISITNITRSQASLQAGFKKIGAAVQAALKQNQEWDRHGDSFDIYVFAEHSNQGRLVLENDQLPLDLAELKMPEDKGEDEEEDPAADES